MFATITFPVSAYIDSLCARTSMLVDPQHQYIVFLKQFLKGGFYTGKIWALPTAEITCSSKRRFLHSRKGKFLFYSLPCFYAHYPNSSAGVFRCLRKERFLHRKNQLSHSPPMFARQCSPAIAKARFPPCTICSRNRQYTEKNFENRDSSTAKKRFLHTYFGWLGCSNLFLQPFKPLASGVEISFPKCFFLSAGMWKSLFLHIIINK